MAMRRPASVRRVLVVDPDPEAATRAVQALRAAAVEATAVSDAETGLRTLASTEPDVLVLDLEMPGKGGRWLLRRLRDDFMGARPHVVVMTDAAGITGGVSELGVDAVVLKPAHPAALVAAAAAHADALDTPQRERERMHELLSLSLLSGDIGQAVSLLAKRMELMFRASECLVVAVVGDHQWIGSALGAPPPETDTATWALARVALDAGAPLLVPTARGGVGSHLAIPLAAPGGANLGVILLIHEPPRLYAAETIDLLRALGGRFYAELAWRSVHERIAADRDRLRESSMLDPMLAGVWTRAALDQALPGEVAACQRRREPLTLAVIDLQGMRHINERYGHVAGDAALRHVSYLVRQTLRSQDLVARYMGDALTCALPGAAANDARHVIERLMASVAAAPLEHDGQIVPLAITTGIAQLLGDDDSGEGALARAAMALRNAKRRGEAIVVADEALDEDVEGLVPTEGLSSGTTLGGMYQILHEISRGAMGVVYRAEDLGLGRPVALKTLRPDLARDRNFVERFRAEAATLANLRHENLVQVYAFGEGAESVYFVMELVEGEPLEDRIELAAEHGRFMSFEETSHVISQIAGALDAMHRAGVLHRDVKPSNILLDRIRERAVLVDVGIAKRRGSATDPAGTPGFTAPESFTGGGESTSTDVYGLAATAYTLLCTAAPFGRGQGDEIIQRQIQQAPQIAPSSYRAGIPPSVDRLVLGALDPDPSRRPSSATEFATAFASALAPGDRDVTAPFVVPLAPEPVLDDAGAPVAPAEIEADRTSEAEDEPDTQRPRGPRREAAEPQGGAEPAAPSRVTGPREAVRAPRISAPHDVPAPVPSLREPDLPLPGTPHTRGVLFRSAYRVLGARQGAVWVGQVARKNAALGQALQPQSTLLSWHPTELFEQMLKEIAASGRDAFTFARELGHVATGATFSRFLGADPTALSPWEVLASADLFWRRYHTWGVIGVERTGDTEAQVTISSGPRNALVCASTVGILEQVAALAGALGVGVSETSCETAGAPCCQFAIRWVGTRH